MGFKIIFMKKLIIIAVSLLTFAACTKKSSSTPSGTSLSSTETSLIGTWYLQKKTVHALGLDSTYTGYSTSCYAQFTSSQYGPGQGYPISYKIMDNSFFNAVPPGTGTALPMWWYYNTTTSFLILDGNQFSIVNMSSTTLTLLQVISIDSNTYYFTK